MRVIFSSSSLIYDYTARVFARSHERVLFSRYSSFTEKEVCKASWKSKNRCLSYIGTCRKKYAVGSVVFQVTKLINSFRSNLWLFVLILLSKRKRLSRSFASSILTLFPFIFRTFLRPRTITTFAPFLSIIYIYPLLVSPYVARYTLLRFLLWTGQLELIVGLLNGPLPRKR